MKLFIFSILLTTAISSYAQDTNKQPQFYEVRVDAVSPEVDANDFSDEYQRKNHENFKKRSSLPTVVKRDQAFVAASLKEEVKKMDDLDRDRLWYHAGKLSLEALIKRYPQIPEEKLEKLQELVGHE